MGGIEEIEIQHRYWPLSCRDARQGRNACAAVAETGIVFGSAPFGSGVPDGAPFCHQDFFQQNLLSCTLSLPGAKGRSEHGANPATGAADDAEGCAGRAGIFGVKKEFHPTAMKIGRPRTYRTGQGGSRLEPGADGAYAGSFAQGEQHF
jgi:hypothetical protein